MAGNQTDTQMIRTKPKALLVHENWVDCDPSRPPASAHHFLSGSLRASGLAEQESVFLDDITREYGAARDEAFLTACAQSDPDVVILKLVQGIDVNPRPETIRRVRDDFHIPIVTLFTDTNSRQSVIWMESYASAATANLIIDSYSTYPEIVENGSIYFDTWTPQDPTVFFPTKARRDLDVSFVGSVARYPDRKLAVGLLAASGIDIYQAGGDAEVPLSIEDYAEVLRRSRITLNFSRPVFDEPNFQCKGRVWEATHCGAMLMEQENPETARWLEDGKHYVGFADERDLIEKTEYYLAHEDERASIAATGCHKVQADYSATVFWQQVLDLTANVQSTRN